MPSQVAFERLMVAIEQGWGSDTSSDPARWSVDNPAWGQCAVTALIIQDVYGGTLLRCMVDDISHYWNRLPSGNEIDATAHQFGHDFSKEGAEERGRDYVLSFPATAERYRILTERLGAARVANG